jgi:hypothetical protein
MTVMATAVLDRRDPPGTSTGDGDARCHLWCCRPEVALCGADLSGVEDADDQDEPVCQVCAIADAEGMRCPVEGCTGGTANDSETDSKGREDGNRD